MVREHDCKFHGIYKWLSHLEKHLFHDEIFHQTKHVLWSRTGHYTIKNESFIEKVQYFGSNFVQGFAISECQIWNLTCLKKFLSRISVDVSFMGPTVEAAHFSRFWTFWGSTRSLIGPIQVIINQENYLYGNLIRVQN